MLKRLFVCLVIVILFPTNVSAHSAGQIPFFKINTIFSGLYPIPTTSLIDFKIPQDDSPTQYLVNTSIDFEIDVTKLPIPPEVVKMTTFDWDFGDGEKTSGTLNAHHSYKKSGSYFLEITARTENVSQPQLIQSNLVNVVPFQGYQLPKAIILVNGETVKDSLSDVLKLEFGKEMKFDASSSTAGSGKLMQYYWDLGDGKSANTAKLNYTYQKDQYAYFPVLRVTDENGLIGDSFLQVTNTLTDVDGVTSPSPLSAVSNHSLFYPLLYWTFGLSCLLIIGLGYRWRKKLFHKSKH